MSLNWKHISKDHREASSGKHHYAVAGNYYHGYSVYYATGDTPPPNGPQWVEITTDNSIGKAERSASRHFKSLKKTE